MSPKNFTSPVDTQLKKTPCSKSSTPQGNIDSINYQPTNADLLNAILDLRNNMNDRVDKLENLCFEYKQKLSHIENSMSIMEKHQEISDTHEAIFHGIPNIPSLTDYKAIKIILQKLKLEHLFTFIFKIRKWNINRTKSNDPSAQFVHNNYRSIVAKLTSTVVRDEIIAKSFVLKDENSQSLFGSGDSSKISIQISLPSLEINLFFLLVQQLCETDGTKSHRVRS